MVLHGEIRKLGEKRSRAKINVMLKEEACNIKTEKKTHERKYENVISHKVKVDSCCNNLSRHKQKILKGDKTIK